MQSPGGAWMMTKIAMLMTISVGIITSRRWTKYRNMLTRCYCSATVLKGRCSSSQKVSGL